MVLGCGSGIPSMLGHHKVFALVLNDFDSTCWPVLTLTTEER